MIRIILLLILLFWSALPAYAENYTTYEQQRLIELQALLHKAESNDPKAQEELGKIFENGNDLVARNTDEAFFWYSIALKNINGDLATQIEKADKGSYEAAEEVCTTMVEDGDAKAADACKRYAEWGFPLAQAVFCQNTITGSKTTELNREDILKWCIPVPYSQIANGYLAVLYEHGLGVTQSLENAYYWFATLGKQESFLPFFKSLRDEVALHLSTKQLLEVQQRLISGPAPPLPVVTFDKPKDKPSNGFCPASELQIPQSSSHPSRQNSCPPSRASFIRPHRTTWKPNDYNRYMSVKTRIRNRQPRPELIQITSTTYVSDIRAKAESGEPDAQAKLANLYIYGRGVPKDRMKAYEWYLKAAENGHAEAQLQMASIHNWGNDGVPQSYEEGTRWYRKAAENGHIRAQCFLGDSYFRARGVNQDYAEAIKWYQKSAEGGDFDAQAALGTMYYSGKGVQQSFEKAYFWLSLYSKSDPLLRPELIVLADAQLHLTPEQITEIQKRVDEWKPTPSTQENKK